MKARHLIPTLAVAAVAAIPGAATASAAVTQSEQVSENWSGYVASGASAFSSVSGSWVQPTADCSAGDGYSAFWVGLGGAGQQSQALEQVGTQSDCVSGGQTDYYAWYELVPSAPVKLPITISPGDHVAARVTVDGTTVTVSLSDETTGASSTKTLQMSAPDSSSAEWIAEAPSTCDESGNCQPLPLADFGTVTFTSTSATADGHTGSISDPNWTAVPVALSGGGSGFVSDQGSSADAQPTSLSSDGSSFSVAWQSDSSAQSAGGYGGDSAGGYGGDGYS
ncbi:MAG: G1 family glutamic endopeptidase, partial [Solirubrobacteraceae bacterium]